MCALREGSCTASLLQQSAGKHDKKTTNPSHWSALESGRVWQRLHIATMAHSNKAMGEHEEPQGPKSPEHSRRTSIMDSRPVSKFVPKYPPVMAPLLHCAIRSTPRMMEAATSTLLCSTEAPAIVPLPPVPATPMTREPGTSCMASCFR